MIPQPAPASRSYLLRLVLLGAMVVAGVALYTRGTSRQLAVEARLPTLVELAQRHGVPLPALVAMCVAEGFRSPTRSDAEIVVGLAQALRGREADVAGALRALSADSVEAAMVVDLWRRNATRWERLAR